MAWIVKTGAGEERVADREADRGAGPAIDRTAHGTSDRAAPTAHDDLTVLAILTAHVRIAPSARRDAIGRSAPCTRQLLAITPRAMQPQHRPPERSFSRAAPALSTRTPTS